MKHFIFGEFEIVLGDNFAILARGHESGFVYQVGQIGSSETGSTAGDNAKIHVVGQRRLLGVDLENRFAAANIGTIDHDAAIKTAGAEKGGIEHVWTVRSGD